MTRYKDLAMQNIFVGTLQEAKELECSVKSAMSKQKEMDLFAKSMQAIMDADHTDKLCDEETEVSLSELNMILDILEWEVTEQAEQRELEENQFQKIVVS